MAGRPGGSEVPRNPLTRWDVSSIPANGIFLTKKLKNKNKNAQRVVVVVVSHIQRIGCQSEKTTLHGGQSRSWSVEQGKKKERKKSQAAPPPHPARCSFGEKKKKKKKSRDVSTYLGATQVGVTQVVSVRLASVQGFLRLVS